MPGSDVAGASHAFELLHEGVRRWIWRSGWDELRDIQERSIRVLIEGDRDLVVAASTASGKTEAAFLPIVSRLADADREPGGGFDALYVSPLRALINDQFRRLEGLCEELSIPVVKWHGDVAASVKARARKRPGGIVLTTPESLEALLCRRGGEAVRLFGSLSYMVVDEMHAFLDQPRGRQLQSLLHRIEIAAGSRVTRVGLSATLADMRVAARFLRPDGTGEVAIVESSSGGGSLKLQLRGYPQPKAPGRNDVSKDEAATPLQGCDEAGEELRRKASIADAAITAHVFDTMRGKRGLVFAGSRKNVERMTADLGALTEAEGVPVEFFAHHGSLSREIREEAEQRLKEETRPASIVCTTTLELGLDVGHIEQVAQLGPGHTVSGMRQRLGRSGRRAGYPAVMRIYVKEAETDARSDPADLLRTQVVQAIAMVNLMLRRWNEPAIAGRLHLSTLVQQILALIAQHGGITAVQGWERLCASGVFPGIDAALFAQVLRRMAHPDVRLIEQVADGTLLPAQEGERVLARHDFFAVFMTPEEYRVVTDGGRTLGTVPVENPLVPQQLIIFGGRRWRVLKVDAGRKEIIVGQALGGSPPEFGGDWGAPADGVVLEMRAVWEASDVPTYLDPAARELLSEGRAAYRRMALYRFNVCQHDGEIFLFPWCGSRAQTALSLSLTSLGLENGQEGLAIRVPAQQERKLRSALADLAVSLAPYAAGLATFVADKVRDKYDSYLVGPLLDEDWASERLDVDRVPALAAGLLKGFPEPSAEGA